MAARQVQLHEDVHRSGSSLRVDRRAGIIHQVKVLGLVSANGRRYTAAALHQAAGLYEGRPVNVNHPARPGEPRSAYDRFGILRNVQARPDGLYGDLHYLKAHPLAAVVAEAAERMPTAFGLSHNAVGRERPEGAGRVVEAIERVLSVDLVSDPATTGGLFEGRGAAPLTASDWLALCLAPADPPAARAALREQAEPAAPELTTVIRRLEDALANVRNGVCGPGTRSALEAVLRFLRQLAREAAPAARAAPESRTAGGPASADAWLEACVLRN